MKTLLSKHSSRTHHNGAPLEGDSFKRQLLRTLVAIRDGNSPELLPSDLTGLDGKLADTLNEVATRMQRFDEHLYRLRNEVGRKGRIDERMPLGDSVGGWAERTEAINSLVDHLSQPTVEMGRVIGAVAKGDLSQSVPLEVRGKTIAGRIFTNGEIGQRDGGTARVISRWK